MTVKDALFRELKFALCGAGGDLEDLVAQDRVRMDSRGTPASARGSDDYPWLIFRVTKNTEDDQVKYARTVVEMAIIGLRTSASKGEDLLESIRTTLIDYFAAKQKTWGKFTASGVADPSGGLRMCCHYQDTVEALDDKMYEKAMILVFEFTFVRS